MEETPVQNRGNENSSERVVSTSSGKNPPFPTVGDSFRDELSRLLYKPLPRSNEVTGSSLSVIPWKIVLIQETPTSSSDFNLKSLAAKVPPPTLPGTEKKSTDSKVSPSLPSASYLDLRRKQNLCFADAQCSKAHDELENGKANPSNAWKQALQLVPDHMPSLVGYGKYLLQIGKLAQAEKLLTQSLSIYPKHGLALRLLSELFETRRKRHRRQLVAPSRPLPSQYHNQTSNLNLATRESSAYQDALLERQLMASPKDDGSTATVTMKDSNPRLHREESKDRKRNKSRKHKDRRKKRKRKERRKHHRHHKKRRRHGYYSSDDSSSSDRLVSSKEEDGSPSIALSDAEVSSASNSRSFVLKEESPPRKGKNYETSRRESDEEDRQRNRRRKKRRPEEGTYKRESRRRKHHRKQHKRSTSDSVTST